MTDQKPLEQIGDFEIIRHLGAGGMGVVYLARQISLNRKCALKVLGGAIASPHYKSRFQREARSVAKLKHPNIPAIYFVGQDSRYCYLAMEYIDGRSLRSLINDLARTTEQESGLDDFLVEEKTPSEDIFIRFDDNETLEFDSSNESDAFSLSNAAHEAIANQKHIARCVAIIKEIASALDHAHQNGIVHRDLKPDNIMVSPDGNVFVIDFGVAQFLDEATLTHTGQLVGTPIYMSPEQVTGRIEIDERSDVYSLGILLYELLTLQPPITAPTREGVLKKVISKPLQPVSWLNGAVPKPLENIVHKMTDKDADERYASMNDIRSDLNRYETNQPVVAPNYRMRQDLSEIILSRPRRITASAGVIFLPSLVAVWNLILHLVIYWGNSTIHLVGLWVVLQSLFCVTHAVGGIIGSVGILRGTRLGWWSTFFVCSIAILWPIIVGPFLFQLGNLYSRNFFFLVYSPAVACAAFCLFAITSKKSKLWFKMAQGDSEN